MMIKIRYFFKIFSRLNNFITFSFITLQVVNACRDESRKAGAGITKEQVWQYFCQTCKDNLHLGLIMNPSGDFLRTRSVEKNQ